ncbi:hypothetical protein HYW53_02605 [Candidatus Giovannonibacteria bacterium]|nr:hypothetical protein [Candidatus Giovannonibacteria bacterium]
MPLSVDAIKIVLGISEEEIPLDPDEMAKKLSVTFYPIEGHIVSERVLDFSEKLRQTLSDLGVNIIPYEKALVSVTKSLMFRRYFYAFLNNIKILISGIFGVQTTENYITLKVLSKIKKGKKVRKGIRIISLGEGSTGNLPMDNVQSFTDSTVITILDMPEHIDETTDFSVHFDTSFKLFAYHMTNIIIGVGEKNWILYNFNASHPIYPLDINLKKNVLYSLIPKIAAPIRPPSLAEFTIRPEVFDVDAKKNAPFVNDLVESGHILEKTGLFLQGKSIHELSFRNEFYEWVGRIHLDHRTGMSFGFLARQLPVKLPLVWSEAEAKEKFSQKINSGEDYFFAEGKIILRFDTGFGKLYVENPEEVWVLTQRSGANKTRIDPHKDIIKMGICKGKMMLETPRGLKLLSYYKPSFDTKVILAHALGNVIIAALLKKVKKDSKFSVYLEEKGMAISHWHGYINPEHIPVGWHVYGLENPPVSCSSPQSAIYAFQGKEKAFIKSLSDNKEYLGDIHIEPQHGTNIVYTSLRELGGFLNSNKNISSLGNKHLVNYK